MCLILKHINPEKRYRKNVVNIPWGRCRAKLFILFPRIGFVLKAAAEGFYYIVEGSHRDVSQTYPENNYLQYYKYLRVKKAHQNIFK